MSQSVRLNNNSKIDYQFILQHDKLSNEMLVNIISEYSTVFEPLSMFGETKAFDEQSFEEIRNLNLRFQGLYIEGKDKSKFCFGSCVQNRLNPRCFFSFIYLNETNNILDNSFINTILEWDYFKIAFMGNAKYNFNQSEDNPQSYYPNNNFHQPLSKKELKKFQLPIYFDENIQLCRIDLSNNPGRERFLPGMKFIPAYKIWYGQESQDLFGKEKILNYPNAIYTKELKNGVIEMQLIDDITKCALPYNQEKQREIVSYFGIEQIEVSKY
jgi:hypothetical protein